MLLLLVLGPWYEVHSSPLSCYMIWARVLHQFLDTALVLKVLCPICRPKNEKVKFQLHLKDNNNLDKYLRLAAKGT